MLSPSRRGPHARHGVTGSESSGVKLFIETAGKFSTAYKMEASDI
jgi:hypothetical protein